MSGVAKVELEQDLIDAAAERAAQEGMSVNSYVSLLLRRAFEREVGETSVLVYDHVDGEESPVVDRMAGEDEESYRRRSVLYTGLFSP